MTSATTGITETTDTHTASTAVDITLASEELTTPIGTLIVLTDEHGRVRAVDWTDYIDRMHRLLRLHYGWDRQPLPTRTTRSHAATALAAYFAGDVDAIAAVPGATGGTTFQQSVWRTLRDIPAGETWSYARLATAIDHPRAVRAVGLANGANPIGIIVPCHRVIGANGSLTGYGGGIERKRWLLDFEAAASRARRATRAADDSWA